MNFCSLIKPSSSASICIFGQDTDISISLAVATSTFLQRTAIASSSWSNPVTPANNRLNSWNGKPLLSSAAFVTFAAFFLALKRNSLRSLSNFSGVMYSARFNSPLSMKQIWGEEPENWDTPVARMLQSKSDAFILTQIRDIGLELPTWWIPASEWRHQPTDKHNWTSSTENVVCSEEQDDPKRK